MSPEPSTPEFSTGASAINELRGISFQPPGGHLWPFILLGAALAAYALWTYRRNPAPMPAGLRGLLWGLRALAFLLLLGLICRPVLTFGASDRGRRLVALLFDTSESLTLPAGAAAGGPTRALQGRQVIESLLPALASKHTVRAYGFDRDSRPLPDQARELVTSEAARPRGDITGMGPALEKSVTEIGRSRAGAVVLISDGVSNSGLDPLAVARRLALPVYTVGLGQDSVGLDAAVARLQVNRQAFLGDEVPVAVTVHNTGMGGRPTELTIVDVTRPGQSLVVAHQALTWAAGGAEQEIRLAFRPNGVGEHFYEIRLPEAAGEFTGVNNVRMFALDVREEKNRVLLLSGGPDWDLTFLKRALDADSSLSVSAIARLGGSWHRLGASAEPVRLQLDAAEVGRQALVILHNMSARDLPAAGWEALTAWTRRGGGLLILSGSQAGGLRRLAGAPVVALLPVDPGNAAGTGSESIPVALTASGQRHPAAQAFESDAANLAAWADLPPLSSTSGAPALRGTADVLAAGSGADHFPALVAGRAEAGKVLVAPAFGFWRWAFQAPAFGDKAGFHDHLWTNAVRWLTSADLASRLLVEPGRPVFERGDAVDFAARLADREYQPLDGAEISVTITADDSGRVAAPATVRSLTLTDRGGGFYSGETTSLPPGRYRFHAMARRDRLSLGEASGPFAVETMGLEFRRPAADPAFLARLAAESGGRSYRPDDVRRLVDELELRGSASQEVVTVDVWDNPWFFVTLVGLLSTEWILRRRRGMV